MFSFRHSQGGERWYRLQPWRRPKARSGPFAGKFHTGRRSRRVISEHEIAFAVISVDFWSSNETESCSLPNVSVA